jgi:hypothetical protein
VGAAQLTAGVCAVQAVMLGGASPLSRSTWSRRTRDAQGRPREGGAEGRVQRRGGARDTHRRRGVGRAGRVGPRPHSPPSPGGRAVDLRRLGPDRRPASPGRPLRGPGPWRATATGGVRRTPERSPGRWPQRAASRRRGRDGLPGRTGPQVGRGRQGPRPGGRCRGEPHADAWAGARMLTRPNCRLRAPHVRGCGRGEVVRPPPLPIDMTANVKSRQQPFLGLHDVFSFVHRQSRSQ